MQGKRKEALDRHLKGDPARAEPLIVTWKVTLQGRSPWSSPERWPLSPEGWRSRASFLFHCMDWALLVLLSFVCFFYLALIKRGRVCFIFLLFSKYSFFPAFFREEILTNRESSIFCAMSCCNSWYTDTLEEERVFNFCLIWSEKTFFNPPFPKLV